MPSTTTTRLAKSALRASVHLRSFDSSLRNQIFNKGRDERYSDELLDNLATALENTQDLRHDLHKHIAAARSDVDLMSRLATMANKFTWRIYTATQPDSPAPRADRNEVAWICGKYANELIQLMDDTLEVN